MAVLAVSYCILECKNHVKPTSMLALMLKHACLLLSAQSNRSGGLRCCVNLHCGDASDHDSMAMSDTADACKPGSCSCPTQKVIVFDLSYLLHHCYHLLLLLWQGRSPPVQVALELYNMLSESGTDLRQPVGLEDQLLQDQRMGSDVGQSMLQLLQVRPCCLPLFD